MNGYDVGATEADLAVCAREQIHIPGAIQPHGALLAAASDTLLVTHASANLAVILGIAASDALGQLLGDVLAGGPFGAAGGATLDALLGTGSPDGARFSHTQSIPGPGGGLLHLQAHRTGRRICLDLEPARDEAWQRPDLTMVQSILQTFRASSTPRELCERAASGVRMITGHDRVMVYRFNEDGHGEVIAEACAPEFEAFLGQHYPATDIPPQAKQQYLRQRVGVIPDSRYSPVPLLVEPVLDDGTPLDLTHSALRSVSPMHRGYMRNMGTQASLTIALTQQQTLWGLLVCHHHTAPRVAGPELRAAAGMIGDVVSLLIGALSTAAVSAQRVEGGMTLRTLTNRLTAPMPLIDTFVALEAELLHLVNATGAVIRIGDRLVCLGRTPGRRAAEQALAVLHPGPGGENQGIDDLGLRHPALVDCAHDGSGALMLPLGQGVGDAILWFRPEQARTLIWGGNPHEHALWDAATRQISPRASFAAWADVSRGRSVPWTAGDLALAQELRHAVEVEMARRTGTVIYLFDRVFASSPTAMLLIGRAGEIRMMNRQAERIFGYGVAELKDKPLETLMPERFRAWVVGQRQRVHADPSLHMAGDGWDLFGLRKDGSEFRLEIGLNPIKPVDFAGEPMFQVNVRDLTLPLELEREKRGMREKEKIRFELEQSNADLEEFSYAVSHDLKAPLRAIGHLAQWIGEDVRPTAKAETIDNIQLMQERVLRMQKLLDGLLEYSRVGRSRNSVETIDIAEIVRDVTAMLAPPPGFVVSYEGPMATLRTERVALQMVMENLIGNGLKHHDRNAGSIVVTMRVVGGLAEIRVTDDGPGIASQFQRQIFTIFQTLKRRDELESSGIGLAIVKRKVETHGGRIWIESAPPVRGCTFVFTWAEAVL